METVERLIHNATVVTCASPTGPKRGAALADPGIIARGAVAVDEGRLVAVGPSAEVLARYRARDVIDAGERALLPGFIDPHTHLVFAGDRVAEFELRMQGAGYLEILAAGGGILSTMRATRAAPAAQLLNEARRRLAIMAAHGVTTVEIKSGYGLDTATELKQLATAAALALETPIEIVPTFLGAHAVPPEFAGRSDDYVALVVDEMLPAVVRWYAASPFAGGDAPFACDLFCEAGVFSLAQSRRVLTAAQGHGMAVKIHADEFANLGGATLAVELGALSADHLDVTPPAELATLAASPTVGVFLPAVNFHLRSERYADARTFIDAGGAPALSTDLNPGSAPCYSPGFVMALACRQLHMSPAEALAACTVNAAHALRLGHRIGSLEAGKQADMLLLESDDYRHLAYWVGHNPVVTVFKKGERISG